MALIRAIFRMAVREWEWLDQMPAFATPDRLKSTVYGGGHMYYSRDASRRALRDDAMELYRAAEQAPRG